MEQSLNLHTQTLGGNSTPQEDLGPLAWVLDEVKTSVEVASRALKQFASDASIATGTDLASLDDTQLRLAGQQLHQAMGALTMVGLEKPSKLLLQMNTVIQRFLSKPELCTPDAATVLDKAGYALTFYLESYLSGRKISAIALFPQYADVSELAEDRLAHPSQLWEHEWRWLDIEDAGGSGASQVRPVDAETRAPMDRWVLQVVRAMDVNAAAELREVALAISRSPLPRQTVAFWRLAAGYFDAVAQELLAYNRYTKRAASQVLMQFLKQMKAPDQVSPDLAHELLFHCAQSPTPDAGSALGRVRAAYALERHIPLDYETIHFGQVDPATVARARKYLTTAKETWSLVSGGELNRLDRISMQFTKLCGLLSELLPSGQGLADALQQCADGVAATRRPPNTTQALEVATAILYVEAVLEDFDLNDPTLPERSRRLCERIQSAQAGSSAEPLESWMEELYRRVSDRQNMGSVVGELKATLAEVEKHMDEYFRNPEDKSCLQDVPHGMSQMRGVLSVLDMGDATQTVLQMREVVENIMVGNASPEALREEGIFERLGNNLGALGFLIDMLSYQPVLARKLFVFDSINGELRPLMGVQKEAVETDAEKAGFVPSTVIVGGDEWKDASTLIPDEEAIDGGEGGDVQEQVLTATADDEPEILLEADSRFNTVEASDANVDGSVPVQLDAPQTQKADVSGGALSDPGTMANLQVADFVPAADALSLDTVVADRSEPEQPPLSGTDTDAAVATEVAVTETLGQVRSGQTVTSAVVEDDDFDQEIFEIFLEEARETVTQARDTIGALRKNPANITDLTNLRRSYHTLKGSGRMVELTEFSEAAWAMEQLFNAWLAESRSATDELLDLAEQSMLGLGDWIEAIDSRTDGSHTAQAYAVSADAMRLDKRFVPLAVHAGGEVGAQPQDRQAAVTDALQSAAVSEGTGGADRRAEGEEAVGEGSDAAAVGDFMLSDAVTQQTVTEKPAGDDAVSLPLVQGMSEQTAETGTEAVIEPEAVTGGAAEQSVAAPDFDLGADLLSPEQAQPEAELAVELGVTDAQDGSVTVTEEVSDEVDFAELSDFDLNLLEAESESAGTLDIQAAEQQKGSAEGFAGHLSDWSSSDVDVTGGLPVADSGAIASEFGTAAATAVADWQADLGAASDRLSQAAEDAGNTGEDEVLSLAGAQGVPAAPADLEDSLTPVFQAVEKITPDVLPRSQGELEGADAADADEYKVIGPLRISIPLFNVYLAEADEWSRKLLDSLSEWAMETHRLIPEDAISYAHSLAGSSGTIGFLSLSGLARELEHVMERDFQAGSAEFSQGHAACFVAAATAVRSMLQGFAAGELKDSDPSVLANLEAVMAETPPVQETSMGGLGVLDDSMERLRRAEASRKEDWEALVDLDAPVADSGYFANSLRRDTTTVSSEKQPAVAAAVLPPVSESRPLEPVTEPEAEAEEVLPEAAAVTGGDDVREASANAVSEEALQPTVSETEEVGQGFDRQQETAHLQESESEDILTDIWSSDLDAVTQGSEERGEEAGVEAKKDVVDKEATESDSGRDGGPALAQALTAGAAVPVSPTAPTVTALSPIAGASASVEQALPERPDSAEEAVGEKKSVLITATDDVHAHDHSDADGLDVEDVLDEDLFPIFEEEAQELIPQLSSGLRDWSSNVGNSEARAQVLRVLHTLKGSARLAGALRMGEMAHNLESVIEVIGSEGVEASQVEPLLEDCDNIVNEFERLRNTDQQEQVAAEARIESGVPAMASPDPAVAALVEVVAEPDLTVTGAEVQSVAQPQSAVPAAGGVVGLPARRRPSVVKPKSGGQTVRVRSQLLDRILNQTGEVMITRSRLEGGLGQLRASVADLSSNLERLRAQLRDVEVQAETQMQSRMAQNQEAMQTFDPLEFDRFTRMQELTRMMAESVNDVATVQRTIQKTVDATEADLMAQARQTRELQRDLLRTRMVEFDSVSERLYRVVRQSAKETGKSVRLDLFGGRIEMDRGVLDRMTPVFEHLLRNAVAHGIEPSNVRLQAGKEEAGTIGVSVSQDGNDVAIEFRDDGAGLDLEAIKQKALRQGLIDDTTVISDQEAANLVFRSGFSTATDVTRISGRGVGMDVVRSEVNALGGRIETQTVSGQGASFKVVVPLTTAVTQVVMLRAGEVIIGVPASLLEIVRRAAPAQIEEAYAKGNFKHGQDTLPFYWMGALLQSSRATLLEDVKTMSVVVFRSAAQRLAVHVDEVLGNQEVVVKNLGPQLSGMPGLAGMSILPSGSVVLIYNPVALATVYGESVQAYLADQAAVEATASVSVVPLIMVVDDSITVRRITQRFLQREGYRVVLAADGLQALEKLPDETPAVVLSDIEMPRMDGFDLLRNIRANSAYKELPVVMITSRIAEKHKEHAISLGANHYLGKPYSEEQLLALVRGYTQQSGQVVAEAH